MQSLMLHIHVGKDGILKLEMPIDFRDTEVDVVLVVNASGVEHNVKAKPGKQGWPPGFLDRFAGSMPDLPPRAPQGEFEIRDTLE